MKLLSYILKRRRHALLSAISASFLAGNEDVALSHFR